MNKIQNELFAMRDEQYKEFHKKLIPNVDEDLIIGVRTPQLRAYAKSISKTDEAGEFLKSLPHKYYEENNLHAFLLEQERDYDALIEKTREFLPYVDNWATCDMFSPKILKKHTDKLWDFVKECLISDKTYTIRYGIGLLMRFYLDEHFNEGCLKLVAEIESNEYYVNMMRAWYFAEALSKQYQAAVLYIQNKRLDRFTHNKAIQKATESRRIEKEIKEYLKTMKY